MTAVPYITGNPYYDANWAAASGGGIFPIAPGDILANLTGSSANPLGHSLSAVIDDAIGSTPGDILVRGASNWQQETLSTLLDSSIGSSPGEIIYRASGGWTALASGTAGTIFLSDGANPPTWAQVAPGFGGLVAIAPNNGVTNATSALTTLAALNVPLFIPLGTYLITGSITFTQPVTFAAGAVILCSTAAVVVTFSKGLTASVGQIFNLSGGAVAVLSNILTGCPEWWGAITGSPTTDCGPAINACIVAAPVTLLQMATYYINTLISIQIDGRAMVGQAESQLQTTGPGSPGTGTLSANATNIVLMNNGTGTTNGVQIGSSAGSQPSQLVQFVRLKDINIFSATASAAFGVSGALAIQNPASGVSPAPTGVIMRWCANCTLERVLTAEFSYGFSRYGTIENYMLNCTALRYTPGTHTGNDFWTGFYHDNSAPLGANSGNASVYMNRCRAFSNEAVSLAPTYSYNAACQFFDGYTDSYIVQLESGNCGYGIDAVGRSSTAIDAQTEDLIIEACVLDSCRNVGVRVTVGGPQTAVQIQNTYIGVTLATSPVSIGIEVLNVHGSVNIQGNQIIGVQGNPATGLRVDTSSGVVSRGNIYTDMQDPVIITTSFNVRCEDIINCAAQGPATAGVQITDLTRGVIDCDIHTSNATATIPCGVDLIGSSNTHVVVRMGNVDPTYITGNPLQSNGSAVTTNGTFSTNCLAAEIT